MFRVAVGTALVWVSYAVETSPLEVNDAWDLFWVGDRTDDDREVAETNESRVPTSLVRGPTVLISTTSPLQRSNEIIFHFTWNQDVTSKFSPLEISLVNKQGKSVPFSSFGPDPVQQTDGTEQASLYYGEGAHVPPGIPAPIRRQFPEGQRYVGVVSVSPFDSVEARVPAGVVCDTKGLCNDASNTVRVVSNPQPPPCFSTVVSSRSSFSSSSIFPVTVIFSSDVQVFEPASFLAMTYSISVPGLPNTAVSVLDFVGGPREWSANV